MYEKSVCSSMYNTLQHCHWFQSVPLEKKEKKKKKLSVEESYEKYLGAAGDVSSRGL